MWNYFAAALFLLTFFVVVAVLDRTHARTAGRPHAPYGADADADSDLQRVLHDLDARP